MSVEPVGVRYDDISYSGNVEVSIFDDLIVGIEDNKIVKKSSTNTVPVTYFRVTRRNTGPVNKLLLNVHQS